MKIPEFLATIAMATSCVHAHGGMIVPKPRGLSTMGLSIDSTFGFPTNMRGDYTKGKVGDCLDFIPDTNLQPLPFGESKIQMRANDGANHIGPCTVYLVDPQNKSNKLQVGQMANCMRSLHPDAGQKGTPPIPAEMTINIPKDDKLPCQNGHCVLEFYWQAEHLAPQVEIYNNCADVKIGEGGSAAPAAPAAAAKTPVMTPAPAPQGPAPAPAPAAGGYVYNGPHPDVAGMTTWCNNNCPTFCMEYCHKA